MAPSLKKKKKGCVKLGFKLLSGCGLVKWGWGLAKVGVVWVGFRVSLKLILEGWQLKFITFFVHKMKEPERVVLGEKQSWKGSGATRQLISKKNEFMYIPILKTLESMLQCDDTMAKVK